MLFLVLSSLVLALHVLPYVVFCGAWFSNVTLHFPQCDSPNLFVSFYYPQCHAFSPFVFSYCPQVKISGRNSQGYSQFSRPVSYTTPARGQLANIHHILLSPHIFSSCQQCDGCHGCQFSCQFGNKTSSSVADLLQHTVNTHVNCEARVSYMSLKWTI